ncbi:YwiC-like family protein [Robertmurraya kyonggiensis]|uniref:YwiC-like protein n=1 Tax=Robertmurraya kyonggiensis TaxID=1037680 RepID=A0A4U1D9Z7_9BACI|nr:YwiC-like family protein [Robertmurraya kyonggiensis]TKC18256.1 hypothetical protein FA727_01495 [Robertmurraya kyonggiensis]
MKLFMPNQHGAWAMLIIPFWLGVVTQSFIWQHIPFFIGWLLLYLATYPMLLLFKGKKIPFYRKWTLIYIFPALLLLLIPLWTRPSIVYFGLAMIPFFIINAYFSRKKNDRALLNDFSAIIVFGIAGLASAYLPYGHINADTILIFVASSLFFIGSTFYVKTMIREKKNIVYKRISWTYHVIVPVLYLIFGYWIVAIAFIPSLVRAYYFYGKPYTMKDVGVLEIVNAAIFFIVMTIAILI